MRKKLFTLFFALITSVGTMFAASGTCGDNLTWELTNGVLTISGAGAMTDWYNYKKTPWYPYSSSIIEISIGNAVTSIGNRTFSYCTNLTSVVIGNSVTSIGNQAFWNCSSLTSITIPNSVTNIEYDAFRGCSGLNSIVVEDGNDTYDCRDNCNAIIKTATNTLICGCKNTIIPNNVTVIESYAFENCGGLTSIEIPNSVTSIEWAAFCNCTGLTSVTIGNSVTSIGNYAFQSCTGLTSITIPNSVTSIGYYAFSGCKGLTSIVIPNSVTSIGTGAFSGCTNIASVIWNAKNCNSYNFGSQVESFVFGDSVEVIPASLCRGMNKLTSITIPNSVTSIGQAAFKNNSLLETIILGAGIESVGDSAFAGCPYILSVYAHMEYPPMIDASVFVDDGDLSYVNLFVPESALVRYKKSAVWNEFNIQALKETFTITFVNWDGTTLQSTQVEKGEMPQYTGATPTRPEDDEYTYTFAGWTPEIVAVTGDATYTATYTSTLRKYTITFLNEDGSVLSSEQWSYGATPTCDEPTKSADAQYTYTFAGWTPDIVAVTGDATYTATYSSTLRQYTITFKNDDGTTIESKKWDYGTIPTCDEPSKPATAQYTYTFTSWAPGVVAVTSDATYTATYSSIVNKYTITFKDEDGTVLCEDEWEYGSMPSCNEPTKEDDTYYKYTFAGWNPEVVDVTGEATYTATYNREPKEDHGQAEETTITEVTATPTEDCGVIITWPEVNGATTYTIEIRKNEELICTLVFNENGQLLAINLSTPARDGHGRNVAAATQAGKGWTYTINGLEANATFTYSVTAKNDNGSTLFEQSIEFTTGSLQAIDDVDFNTKAVKFFRDGQILILRGGHVYDAAGKMVK